jgi:GNAT superfamily N-acetyltransferase
MVVRPLREYPELVSEFVHRFEQEWPDWYGPGGQGNALQDLRAFANPQGHLPVGVVAISEKDRACGLAALKASSIPEYSHLSPWATAGYVLPELRGQGIGAALLAALVSEAGALGYNTVYCATSTAMSLLHRLGWHLLEETQHDGKPLFLFASKGAA